MVTARGLRRQKLRATVFRLDRGHCPWPECDQPATELAHMHSIGMGGRTSADEEDNAFAACEDHARISDGLPPPGGGMAERDVEYAKVPGAEPRLDGWKTWDVMEALRQHLKQARAKQ